MNKPEAPELDRYAEARESAGGILCWSKHVGWKEPA